jgi:hypothetical protein
MIYILPKQSKGQFLTILQMAKSKKLEIQHKNCANLEVLKTKTFMREDDIENLEIPEFNYGQGEVKGVNLSKSVFYLKRL